MQLLQELIHKFGLQVEELVVQVVLAQQLKLTQPQEVLQLIFLVVVEVVELLVEDLQLLVEPVAVLVEVMDQIQFLLEWLIQVVEVVEQALHQDL